VQQPAPFAEECISMPLDEQAISCYTEEKEVTQESDEKDTLCVSRHYLQKPLKSPVISRFFRFEGSATTPLLHQ
jgi:hypothetical protein